MNRRNDLWKLNVDLRYGKKIPCEILGLHNIRPQREILAVCEVSLRKSVLLCWHCPETNGQGLGIWNMMVGCEWFTGQGNEVEYIKNYQEFSLLSCDSKEFSENLESEVLTLSI